tara:strand:- start:2856 stop:3614 length:759 start_codon:yes stop_codon:yes gene_type:complete
MAGHSQFKNIMHRKGAQDAKRAKLFAKLAREITVAVKSGLPDPKQNPRLRNAIINARHENMPNDKINKAIQKGSSGDENNTYQEIRYEGYGVNGIAFIIETLTDNKNRTASEIRSILSKNGGNLGEDGSVAFNFKRVGEISFELSQINKDEIFDYAIEYEALDIVENQTAVNIYSEPHKFGELRNLLEEKFGEPKKAKLVWQTENEISVDEKIGSKILDMIEALEENDDVQTVYTNISLSDNIIKKINDAIK